MTIDDITTPAYIIDENIMVHNLEILKYVEDKTGCKILLAQKAFSVAQQQVDCMRQGLAGKR